MHTHAHFFPIKYIFNILLFERKSREIECFNSDLIFEFCKLVYVEKEIVRHKKMIRKAVYLNMGTLTIFM